MTLLPTAARRAWRYRICRLALLAVCASAMHSCAPVRPTESWPELAHRLAPGKPVTVTTTAGSDVSGRVSAVSADSLMLTVNGVSRQFASSDVRQVRRNGDPVWNGLAIGAAVGATAAALPDPRYYDCGGPTLCKDTQIPQRLGFFAGAAVAGVLIDVLHRDRTVLYHSPSSPIPGREPATKK